MAKVTAPLLSIDATGTFGKTATFSKWKGIGYVRQRVIPANPRTTEQTATRSVFSEGSASWKTAPANFTEPFEAFAKGRPLSGRNAYIGAFTRELRGETDLSKWITSPGARSGSTIGSLSGVAGGLAGEVDMTYAAPDVPAGWTLDAIRFVTKTDQSPAVTWAGEILTEDDTVASGTYTIDGLTAATDYAVSAYAVWTRPDGQKAFGASRTVIVTSAA